MTRSRPAELELRRTARRIGLQTAGLLMACLVVVGVVLYGSVVRSQAEQLSTSLSDAVGTAGTGGDGDHDHDHDLNEPRGGIQYAVLDERGLRTSTDVPPGLPDLDVMRTVAATHVPDRRTLRLPTGGFEVLTVQRGDDTVQVMASTFEQHQERERILGGLALAGGAGLVLATLAAAVLARRAVRPMAQALEQQRRFVADAGHELRTPLTLLSTRSQLLARRVRDRSTPAEQRDRLVERDAAGIVADTAGPGLDPRGPAHRGRRPDPGAAGAGRPRRGRGIGGRLGHGGGRRGGRTADGRDRHERSGHVLGARTALARAVAALVDNAVDHAQGEVGVRVDRVGRSVVVQVADDGPGVAAETLPRMFDRFASDRRPTTEAGERRHFGLGLALVSEIARRHGGTVSADNRQPPVSGALLTLTVPAGAR